MTHIIIVTKLFIFEKIGKMDNYIYMLKIIM